MQYSIDELEIYQISLKLSNDIWNLVFKWQYFEKQTIGTQLTRAIDSVSANIAEGHGRFFIKENLKFCYYARGSLLETKSWLQKARTRSLIEKSQSEVFMKNLSVLHKKLNGYIKFLKNQNKKLSKS